MIVIHIEIQELSTGDVIITSQGIKSGMTEREKDTHAIVEKHVMEGVKAATDSAPCGGIMATGPNAKDIVLNYIRR